MGIPELKISSPAFKDGEMIPAKFTADGNNVNPELNIEDLPENTKSIVLIVDDPDAPRGIWTHWVVFNIPATKIIKIEENSVPNESVLGMNDFKQINYRGPSPPAGTHKYFFRAYALDKKLDLGEGALLDNVKHAIEGHILAQAELMGVYSRK